MYQGNLNRNLLKINTNNVCRVDIDIRNGMLYAGRETVSAMRKRKQSWTTEVDTQYEHKHLINRGKYKD